MFNARYNDEDWKYKGVLAKQRVSSLQLNERQNMSIINMRVHIKPYQSGDISLQDKLIDTILKTYLSRISVKKIAEI